MGPGDADLAAFEMLDHRSLVSQTANFIKDLILEGKLGAGQRLPSERELSEALGVSRPTLREAIQHLIAVNILVTSRGAGTRVGSLQIEDLLEPAQFALALAGGSIVDLFELRIMLEPEVAALAAMRRLPEDAEDLLRIAEHSRDLGHDPVALIGIDEEIHGRVARCSGNGVVVNVLKTIELLGHQSRGVTVHKPHVAEVVADHHILVAQAILRGDPDAARDAMRLHIQTVRDLAQPIGPDGAKSEIQADLNQ